MSIILLQLIKLVISTNFYKYLAEKIINDELLLERPFKWISVVPRLSFSNLPSFLINTFVEDEKVEIKYMEPYLYCI